MFVEIDGFKVVIVEGGWLDLMWEKFLELQKFYMWWSYCVKDWDVVDKGCCFDYIWLLLDFVLYVIDIEILCEVCGWIQLFDYVLVIVCFVFQCFLYFCKF